MLGIGDLQAVGNFMRTNRMTNSCIVAGRNYFIPNDVNAYGNSSALGQYTLIADNALLKQITNQLANAIRPNMRPSIWRIGKRFMQKAKVCLPVHTTRSIRKTRLISEDRFSQDLPQFTALKLAAIQIMKATFKCQVRRKFLPITHNMLIKGRSTLPSCASALPGFFCFDFRQTPQ
jgi:hypothetical protein